MKTTTTTFALQNNSTNANIIKKLFITGALALLSLTSCETNDDVDIEVITPDDSEIVFGGLELQNSIIDSRENDLQQFTVDGTTGGIIVGAQGTQLSFQPSAFENLDGTAVTGNVDIELIEIYGRADMLKKKLPTNGKQPNGDVVTIISGGEFFINATQNGNQLRPAQAFDLTAPVGNSAGFNPEMTVFRPDNDCDELDCDVVWEEDEEADVRGGEIQNADGTWTSAYIAPLTGFGWTNLDRWWSYAGPKTMVYVDVPEGFNETNSAVYVSYDGEPDALALFDTYDTTLEQFTEHYGQMPIGQQVHFIFVSVQDGDYVYAIQGATIVDGHTEIIGTTQTTSEAGLTALIDALP
ncbi:hypothetical protein EAX61_13340 [Dokdonia sinensis]|uniref:Uncharacterized protein n=1 Tax=Dokdonia sinensis TaxID=2479847 RepID=A0A3M0FWE1_9FLAO|nr:hypothetical protein [Dokdonia sinensis]RMB56778.1 hypothetical protein EAX61_13340 [Dokdonia sinensis]